MHTAQVTLMSVQIALLISNCAVMSEIFYVTTPEVFAALGLSQSYGTYEEPFTSVSETIYQASEGEDHSIYISQHDHSLDCLDCPTCLDQCEIFRGG